MRPSITATRPGLSYPLSRNGCFSSANSQDEIFLKTGKNEGLPCKYDQLKCPWLSLVLVRDFGFKVSRFQGSPCKSCLASTPRRAPGDIGCLHCTAAVGTGGRWAEDPWLHCLLSPLGKSRPSSPSLGSPTAPSLPPASWRAGGPARRLGGSPSSVRAGRAALGEVGRSWQ